MAAAHNARLKLDFTALELLQNAIQYAETLLKLQTRIVMQIQMDAQTVSSIKAGHAPLPAALRSAMTGFQLDKKNAMRETKKAALMIAQELLKGFCALRKIPLFAF